jgi:hypothetical protein
MNYLAHAIRFLDRGVFAISTSLPDMLSVVDRRSRLRSKFVLPFADESQSFQAELAAGVIQHLEDDRWFHTTEGFLLTSGELTGIFKRVIGTHDGMRCSFLGHIVTELQLDGALDERYPGLLDEYYARLDEIDATAVAKEVDRLATKPVDGFAYLIEQFRKAQFLRDYRDPKTLLLRLNQVMKRVKLDRLPEITTRALTESWEIVSARVKELLPHDFFDYAAIG